MMTELIRQRYLRYLNLGYLVWLIQNLLVLIAAVVFSFYHNNFYSEGLSFTVLFILYTVSNCILFFALILDLFAIGVLAFVGFYLRRDSEIWSSRIILISAGFWIILSLFWRIPFFLQGPVNFGFAVGSSTLTGKLVEFRMTDPLNNEFMYTSIFFSSFFLFLFFTVLHSSGSTRGFRMYLNRGFFYGFINFLSISFFILSILGVFLPFLGIDEFLALTLWLFTTVFKLFITPFCGMVVAGYTIIQNQNALHKKKSG